MARRYQQGIGVPETLGVQPTMWQEPKAPSIQRWQWNSPNAGVSRNYGSTPGYVDTMPHRWNYGPRNLQRGAQRLGGLLGERDTTLPPPTGPAQGLGAPPMTPAQGMSAPPMGPVEMPSAPSATASRRVGGSGIGTPPVDALSGIPTPTPPSATVSRRVPDFPADIPVDSAGARFMEAIRNEPDFPRATGIDLIEKTKKASSKPLKSPVEWRDDPVMDKLAVPERPIGTDEGEENLAEWLVKPTRRKQITSSPESRTQNRKRKA